MTPLGGWENFYVIVGSSAGALIGLQFVVLALLAELPSAQTDPQAGNAFATPSVVHFAVVLLLSAVVSAPWTGLSAVSALWGFVGICGVLYVVIVARRMRTQKAYQPVFEDWLFHALLPFVAYAALAGSAMTVRSSARPALFAVGAASLLLLFVGIHNAWDAITFHVFVRKRKLEESGRDR